MTELDITLRGLFEPLHYDDGGAGVHNAHVLRVRRTRPAFVDVSSIVYRLMFAKTKEYCKVSDDDNIVSHIIAVDSLKDIADACNQFRCSPVLCFDSSTNIRKTLYPKYKAGRDNRKIDEQQERITGLIGRVSLLLRQVYAVGYNIQCFLVHGYESDDVIASFVLGLKQLDKAIGEPAFDGDVVIISSDHDLHQLVFDKVHFADVRSGQLYSKKSIAKQWIAPDKVVAYKAIAGCTSDNIAGVPFFGDKTAKQVIDAMGFEGITFARALKVLENPQDVLEILRRNEQLIRLPLRLDAPMPSLWLSDKIWADVGVPSDMIDLLENMGIPESITPVFGESDMSISMSPIPMCKRKER